MLICNKCGVELDDGLNICPLCETPVGVHGDDNNLTYHMKTRSIDETKKVHLLKRVLWQVTSVLLLSGIVATLTINIAIQGSITWSIYPVCICLMIFSYASLIALGRTGILFPLLGGWLMSVVVLIVVQWYSGLTWPLRLALPILCSVNAVGVAFILVVTNLRTRGLNVLAIGLIAVSVLCLAIEGIISKYFGDAIKLQWSVIVAACLLPVTAAVFFMFLRTKNNPDLQKIFHN